MSGRIFSRRECVRFLDERTRAEFRWSYRYPWQYTVNGHTVASADALEYQLSANWFSPMWYRSDYHVDVFVRLSIDLSVHRLHVLLQLLHLSANCAICIPISNGSSNGQQLFNIDGVIGTICGSVSSVTCTSAMYIWTLQILCDILYRLCCVI